MPQQNPVQQPDQRKARSDQHVSVEDEHIHLHSEIPLILTEKHIRFSAPPIIALFHLRVRNQIGYFLVQIERDRKSTRLNSSHVSRSYAVFCLKKKITTRHGANQHQQ